MSERPYHIEAIERCRDDDRKFFEQHPDREFRLRRGHDSEYSGEPPSGERVFVILHRDDVGRSWSYFYFRAPQTFRTMVWDDTQIAEFLAKAAA